MIRSRRRRRSRPSPEEGSRRRRRSGAKESKKKKFNNMVLFDQGTYDKLLSEALKHRLISPSILSARLRVVLLLHLISSLF
ncbi:40S ribosomal protein S25-2 [Linum perenne]